MFLPMRAVAAAALLGLATASAGCGLGGPACSTEELDESVLLQLRSAEQDRSSTTSYTQADGRIPVWVWWDYNPDAKPGYGLPLYQEALTNSWNRFAPSDLYEIHYVNHSNILEFLPDFPEETKRVYVEAITDMIRTGLLAVHGGVYFDADFLLARPLKDITDKLKEVDFVTYCGEGQSCKLHGTFSSNFMAARKGNPFSTAWYEKQKKDLKQWCKPGKPGQTDEEAVFYQPVCCYTPEGAERECHIPWGRLGEGNGKRILRDLLKLPQEADDEAVLRRGGEDGWKRQTAEDASITFHCFSEDDDNAGFAPFPADAMWASIVDPSAKEESLSGWSCEYTGGEDLTCIQPNGQRTPKKNFFCRHAYHLFTKAASRMMKSQQYSDLKQKPYAIAKLLRKLEGDEERNCESM